MFPTFQVNSDNNAASDLQPAVEAFDRQPLPEPEQGFLVSCQIDYNDLSLGKELGQGSFGIVYKGTYQFAPVAVKRLQIGNLSSEAQEEFRKEAEMMAQLRHPNIVHFYGYCSIPKCLVMEYMPKGSLFSVLHDKRQILDWNVRIRIAVDMVSGLAFLHSKAILHRDIKSLNVLLDEQGKARLTDFGLSKVKNETKSLTKNAQKSKELVGTLPWIAAELFDGEKYTYKSDIYSLGITFWELASRQIPYAEHTSEAIPVFVSRGKREAIPEDCPEKLAYLIQQCWASNPEARPTASELANFMTTDAKTLQEASCPLSQLSTFSPAAAFNLQASPASPIASLNNALKRRDSVKFNLTDKKDEQEKIRYILEELRTFFSEERDVGEKTENYAIYNEYLKKVHNDTRLVYKPTQNKHILYVNDEPVDAETAAKEISKMLRSLTKVNVSAKPAASPVVQSPTSAAVNVNPIQAASQAVPQPVFPTVSTAVLPVVPMMPAAEVKPPEQKSNPAILIQFPSIAKPAPAPIPGPRPLNASELKELQEFLQAVAEGEQDKAEAMLKKNPALALTPTDVTDLSKRTFKNITALQYALWALDWHMWTMLLKYIPPEAVTEQIAQSERGLWVPQHGVTANWENLIQALNKYVSEVCANKRTSVYRQTWIKQVGGAQLLLPAHVINEYCHPTRPFHPTPDFSKPEPSGTWRTRMTDEGEWFSAKVGGGTGGTLGKGFAVCRGSFEREYAYDSHTHSSSPYWDFSLVAERDSTTVAVLLKTRAAQRTALIAQYLPKSEPAHRVAPGLRAVGSS